MEVGAALYRNKFRNPFHRGFSYSTALYGWILHSRPRGLLHRRDRFYPGFCASAKLDRKSAGRLVYLNTNEPADSHPSTGFTFTVQPIESSHLQFESSIKHRWKVKEKVISFSENSGTDLHPLSRSLAGVWIWRNGLKRERRKKNSQSWTFVS